MLDNPDHEQPVGVRVVYFCVLPYADGISTEDNSVGLCGYVRGE